MNARILTVAVAGALALGAGVAHATVISLDIMNNTNALSPTDVAGLVPAAHWNIVASKSFPEFSNVALVDDAGNATSATATANAVSDSVPGFGNNGSTLTAVDPADPNTKMFSVGKGIGSTNNPAAAPGTAALNIAGLPADLAAGYDVIAYFDRWNASASTSSTDTITLSFTIGGSTLYANVPNASTYNGTFIDAGSTDSAHPGNGNYVRLTGLTGSDFTLSMTTSPAGADDSFAQLTGVQIVPTAVPEPASLGLLGLGALALLRRRQAR